MNAGREGRVIVQEDWGKRFYITGQGRRSAVLLGLNTRLSHFVINQSRGCTFCNGTMNPVPDETFLHLFFDCPTTTSWHDKFLEKFITLPANLTREQRLQLFFFCSLPNGTRDNLFLAFTVILFQFCIWEEKLRKKKTIVSHN
jgi:hypothetical protein